MTEPRTEEPTVEGLMALLHTSMAGAHLAGRDGFGFSMQGTYAIRAYAERLAAWNRRAPLAPPSVTGWQWVPIKPTPDMLYAMAECDGYQRGARDHPMLTQWEDYWVMALEAAPKPEGSR